MWGRVLHAVYREARCAARPCITALSPRLLAVPPARHAALGAWLSLADPALAPHRLLSPSSHALSTSPPQALLIQHSALIPPSPNLALGVRIASCDMVNNSPLPYCKNMWLLFYIFVTSTVECVNISIPQSVIIRVSNNKMYLDLKNEWFRQFCDYLKQNQRHSIYCI